MYPPAFACINAVNSVCVAMIVDSLVAILIPALTIKSKLPSKSSGLIFSSLLVKRITVCWSINFWFKDTIKRNSSDKPVSANIRATNSRRCADCPKIALIPVAVLLRLLASNPWL